MKHIYILLGPSGSGKTTLGNHLKQLGIQKLVSSTNRSPRKDEIEGVDYYFVPVFKTEDYIEWSRYAGKYHGLSQKEVDTKLSLNHEVFAILDWNGYQALSKRYPCVVSIALRLNKETCIQRMIARGDDQKDIARRMMQYDQYHEDKLWKQTDYWIDASLSIAQMFSQFDSIHNKIRNSV